MRENRPAHLFVHTALGQNRLALLGMFFERGVNLPIEIVEQSREGPPRLIRAELAGVGGNACFYRQCVLAESFAFSEFAENGPGVFAVEHRVYDIPASPHAALRAARK